MIVGGINREANHKSNTMKWYTVSGKSPDINNCNMAKIHCKTAHLMHPASHISNKVLQCILALSFLCREMLI